jgi:hypothetical protein
MAGACVIFLRPVGSKRTSSSGKDEAVDYNWLMEFKKTYSASKPQIQQSVQTFIPLSLEEETPKQMTWEVKVLQLQSPDGDSIEIKSNNLYAVSELLRKLS